MISKEYLNIPYSLSPSIIQKNFGQLSDKIQTICRKKITKIAIYGMGINGFKLASELSRLEEYNVIACVDRVINIKIDGTTVLKPNQLNLLNNIDLLIVTTAPNHYTDINKEINKAADNLKVLYLYSSNCDIDPTDAPPTFHLDLDYQLAIIESNIIDADYYSANLMLRTLLHAHPTNELLLGLNKKLAQIVIENDLQADQLIGNVPSPNTTNIQVIDKCNLKCFMCFRQNPHYQAMKYFQQPITREDFHEIIDKLNFKEISTVFLGGSGEVFLHPDVIYFLDQIIKKNCRVHFITNGTMLHTALAEKLAARSLYNLELSLDSFTKKTYESIRIGANFDKVIEQFRNLVKMIKHNKSDVNLSITSILMKQTIEDFPSIIKFAAELGIPTVNGNHLVMAGDAIEHPEESLIFHPQLFNTVISKCREFASKNGIKLNVPALFELEKRNDSGKENKLSAKPWQICHEPWTRLDMGHKGFSICCGGHLGLSFTDEFLHMKETQPFNFKFMTGYNTFSELFNCSTMRQLRYQLLTNTPGKHCRNCLQQSYNHNDFNFNSVFSKAHIKSDKYNYALKAFKNKFKGTLFIEKMLTVSS